MNALPPFDPAQVATSHDPASKQPARPSRRLWRWGALAVLLALAAYAYSRFTAPDPGSALMTAAVTRGDVAETVLASGTLKPSRLVAVGAQASGRITSVKVRLGQKVKAGDLVAEIDSVTQDNALRTAEAALANVRAQKAEKEATLALNEQTLARQRTMVAQKAVSQADFETAEAAVKVTRAQLAALEAQIVEAAIAVDTARANLGYTRITAPIDGTVLALVAQEGQTVNATQSAPTIVILGALDVMTVRAEISEADIVKVAPGMPLWFTILGAPDIRYDSTLAFIEPAPESIKTDSSFTTTSTSSSSSSSSSSSTSSSAIYYMGLFDVPNPDGRLRTYMTAEVHIVLGEAKGVLTVPATALERDGAGDVVRVVAPDGTLTRRKVEVGLNDKITAEIRSGLKEGERVVTGEKVQGAATASRMPGPPMGGL
ncbi:efflux RND transporter periplasmic adaptor subunit [Xanthobacter oligotrophicus]|uniref:efflux RND transporter periplasmic adaptor subunit n=1 Tax=Xanthobacter oligotrophicus TaxID=2607286 RepID=UPI001E42DBCC|nr:efflux RND transporter periplasmic adaptor subunit [Xanthobacter oligotrophicus]MCG5234570.1 efflux RND transporter periplasmic adaptor subunit [Xanthobacter oligotrophicus]